MWQGTTDDGCVALADLLGWKVCHYQINTLMPGCIKQLNIEWEFATFSFESFFCIRFVFPILLQLWKRE